MSRRELTDRLKSEAIRLGFDAVGVAPAVAPPGYPDFLQLARGRLRRRNGLSEPESSSAGAPEQRARRCSVA